MTEERKYAILFAATVLAARKLSDPDLKAWPRAAAIRDAIQKAEQILEEIDALAKSGAAWQVISFELEWL